MCRVHRDRGKQRIELPLAVVVHEGQRRLIQFVDAEDANSLLRQFRPQAFVPAGILFFDELVGCVFDQFPLLHHGEAVGSGGVVAVFQLLQQAAHPDFEEFVQIAGGNRQELDAFEQRIAEISGFFQHAPIKFQPRGFAVEERGAIVQSCSNHIVKVVEWNVRQNAVNPELVSGYCSRRHSSPLRR